MKRQSLRRNGWLAAVLIGTLALTFTACGNTDLPENAPLESDESTVAEPEYMELFHDGVTDYVVVRSDYSGSSDADVRGTVKIRNAVEKALDARIQLTTDWVPRGETVPEDAKEILVGNTNRPASSEAIEGLGLDEYIIKTVGNRIVINATSEEALTLAVDAFLAEALGYDSETDTYTKDTFELPVGYQATGAYTFTIETRENAVKTTTPEKYIVPNITLENGKYVQKYEPFAVTGCMTSMQVASQYSDFVHVNCDSVMLYSTNEALVQTWDDQSDVFHIDMMIAINRADLDWANAHPESVQTTKSGEKLIHGSGGSYYMVPTLEFIEYIWEDVEWSLIHFRPTTIAFEEPEMWNSSGYSAGFKEEWKNYFGEDWVDPNSSAEALVKSMELKTYLFERIIGVMYERIKHIAPETNLYIATHSTVNYNAWSITAGLNHYMATGKVDGIIGQTWSDTIRTAYPYNGNNVVDEYLNAYVDFASYMDSVEGTNFYALADPMADNATSTEESNRFAYLQTIAASLMRPEIHRFEICPWVNRAFGNVSQSYRTVLQQCFNALNEVGGKEITLEAGTPGIAYAMSDTISWLKNEKWSPATSQGLYGITMPLATNGIPVSIKSMEQIADAADLSDVKVLILSYDNQLPMYEAVNDAVAEWVRNGGTLLLLSGQNEYWNAEERFWHPDGSPVKNLLNKLGLEADVVTDRIDTQATVTGFGVFEDCTTDKVIGSNYRKFVVTYDTAAEPLFSVDGRTLAFEGTCGSGHVIAAGLPSTYYSTAHGCRMLRSLTEYAVGYAGLSYVETNLMVTRRGSVVAAHALREDETLEGTYIDLYDEMLSVTADPLVERKNSRLLYDVASLDLSVPRFGFSGGEVPEDENGVRVVTETADQTSFTYTSAGNSMVSTRLLSPKGTYPASVRAVCDGKELTVIQVWNNETSSLLLQIDGSPKPTEVTVFWGTTPVEDGQNLYFREERVVVNNKNLDKDYLIKNTAQANDGLRFCDLSGEIVYFFDVSGMPDVKFMLSVAQNYIVEVSSDNENWTLAADYSEGGTVEHIRDSGNSTILNITPADYGITDNFYFRIRNSNTSMGWGGTLSQIQWRYPVSKEEMEAGNAAERAAKDAASVRKPIDESAYLVSDQNGVKTYQRTCQTNNRGEDLDYLIENTAGENDGLRFCDLMGQLVYSFDLTGTSDFSIRMSVFQNYLIEVSGDGEDWVEVADYSEGGTVPHLTDGSNRTTLKLFAADYGLEGKAMFVRIRNTDVSQGWGGSITQFTISYTRP